MKSLHFAIAQMNPTVGDYRANLRKILAWTRQAEKKGADIIVFPELSLSGYPVWDLANKKRFIAEGLRCLEVIVQATRKMKIAVVAGFIDSPAENRSRSYNAAAWIHRGKIVRKQYKRLLPTYDVFLEEIFFDAGSQSLPVGWRGKKVGLTICEDIWDEGYPAKPLKELKAKRAALAVNISASPFYGGVASRRDQVVKRHAVRHRLPILYVNQVGGQDDLIFDGRSFFADADGKVLFRAPAFREGLFFFDWDPGRKSQPSISPDSLVDTPAEIYEALCLGVRDYCRKNRFEKVLIGLSGGIDSALTAAIAVDALGADKVLGVTMPGKFSSKGSWQDSEVLSRNLGIRIQTRPIEKLYGFFMKQHRGNRKAGKKKISLAMENLQARLRGLQLMYLSNDEDRLLLTTGNKSELAVGYCTLYGDMAGGIAVLGDVYKTDVYRLAWYRNSRSPVIPDAILRKAPSAELRPGQKDEDSLPPYEILDEILYWYIERNASRADIIRRMRLKKISRKSVAEIIRKVDHNEYKRRQAPPILRVTEKAWFGRRMPITNRFEP